MMAAVYKGEQVLQVEDIGSQYPNHYPIALSRQPSVVYYDGNSKQPQFRHSGESRNDG